MRQSLLRAVTGVATGTILALGGLSVSQAHLLIFKDGFVIRGTTKRASEPLVDPRSGQRFVIPAENGFFTVDDGVRNVFFTPGQLQDVMQEDGRATPLRLVRTPPSPSRTQVPSPWTVESVEPWERWTRHIRLDTARGKADVEQRATLLTPERLRVDGYGVDWIAYYSTRELGVDTIRTLLYQHLAKGKETDAGKRLFVSKFLLQCGEGDAADKELTELLKDFPDQKDKAEPLLKTVKELQATAFIDGIERAQKAGQYGEVRDRLIRFGRLGLTPFASEKLLLQLQAIKNKQQEGDAGLKRASQILKEFVGRVPAAERPWFAEATDAILTELNRDTLPRLDLFLGQAPAHFRDLQENRTPGQPTEELLALAISSWVLGGSSGETKTATAKRLWLTRKFLLEYLKTDTPVGRKQLVDTYVQGGVIGLDEIARMLASLPPPEPYSRLGSAPFRVEAADAGGGTSGTYLVQLPPEYHHYRSYPVLIVLHQGDEKPVDLLNRWSDLAGQRGYILVAPEWNSGKGVTYQYTAAEQATVLNALRDLRRRFQVDSDRVFLFGYGQGGLMAFDLGLAHPDLFAGVMPMAAAPSYFATRYGTNAQLLPFYVVNGERTGEAAKANRKLFREWVRWNYPCFYVEYKGRGVEWFGGELPTLLDWMAPKKRAHPLRELGRPNLGNGEEFKTMRLTDNRFYWLQGEVLPHLVNDAGRWRSSVSPASLQATISTGNHISIHTMGIGQAAVWLGPNMIDFNKRLTLRVNGQQLNPIPVRASLETLLEDVYLRGDRQQVYFARVPFKT
jgi:pimeloyl-ACP methyl ester carboxylesterase